LRAPAKVYVRGKKHDKGGNMMKNLLVVAVLITALVFSGLVYAQAKPKVDATIELTKGQVAVGIGWSWGSGTLTYKGKKYSVKVEGLSVVDIGVTKARASGKIYYLDKIEDFNGVYETVAAEGTLGVGAGVTRLRNKTGVMIDLVTKTKGVNFKLAPEGVKLELKK
jgi:hypothetical protein